MLPANIRSQNFDVTKSVELLEGWHVFLKEYTENGLQSAMSAATELANDLQLESEFQSVKKVQHVKCHFHYEAQDEPIMTPQKKFEIEFFAILLNTALILIKEGLKQLHQHAETWDFLYKSSKLPKKEELIRHCSEIQLALTTGSDADIKEAPLCDELISIQSSEKKLKNLMPLNILNFMKKFNMEDLCPNIWFSSRILLTTPVSVASGHRSFSKPKLIKTYLRSSMSHERLSSPAILSTENTIA
jgi:hypothetical protein